MKLYWFQVAPNPTKVRLYIAEKNAGGAGIDVDDVVIKLPKGEQRAPAHRARNPFATLPVLELADGTHLIESLAIIDYLEALYPTPPMWGRDALSAARSRELERIAETRVLNPIARWIHATRSPTGQPPNAGVGEWAAGVWPPALDYFESTLADGREFVAGSVPSVADCTLAAALQFARFAGLDPIGGRAALAAWDERYREREPVRRVLTL